MKGSAFDIKGRSQAEVRALFAYFYKGNSDFNEAATLEEALENISNSRELSQKEVVDELLNLEELEFRNTSGLDFLRFKLETSEFSSSQIDSILELANLHFWRMPPKSPVKRIQFPKYPTHDIRIDFNQLIYMARNDTKLFKKTLITALADIEESNKALAAQIKAKFDQREKFINYLDKNGLKEYGLSISEVVLLGLNHPDIFEIPPGGLIVEHLHEIYLKSKQEFAAKLDEAKFLRNQEFKEAENSSMQEFLAVKLKYLLFEAQSDKLANQAFMLLCRYGDSETWNSVRNNEIDSLGLRLLEIPKLLVERDLFNQIVRELADSPRARAAFKEFSKTSGTPWDLALKY